MSRIVKTCCKDNKKKDQFKARVFYVDQVGGGIADDQTTIELAVAKGLWPNVVEVDFAYVGPFIPGPTGNLTEILLEVEAAVEGAIARGFNYIVLGGSSSFMGPWIDGAGVLGGLNANQRFPTVIFIQVNLGTHEAQLIPLVNFWNLDDTHDYPDLITQNLQLFVKPGGVALAVYEFPDVASESAVSQYRDAALALGIPFQEAKLTFDVVAGQFTASSIAAADAAIAALSAGSVVLLAVNGRASHQDALASQLVWSVFPAGVIPLGINFGIDTVTIPIKLEEGFSQLASLFLAPVYYKELDFSPIPGNDVRVSGFIEALAFASDNVVGKLFRGTDGLSRFDAFRELYFPFIGQTFYPANSAQLQQSNLSENPKWTLGAVLNGPQLDVQPPFA